MFHEIISNTKTKIQDLLRYQGNYRQKEIFDWSNLISNPNSLRVAKTFSDGEGGRWCIKISIHYFDLIFYIFENVVDDIRLKLSFKVENFLSIEEGFGMPKRRSPLAMLLISIHFEKYVFINLYKWEKSRCVLIVIVKSM